jgi:hypothetical protein
MRVSPRSYTLLRLQACALCLAVAWSSAAQTIHRDSVKIEVGPTVQVSKAFANLVHAENLAAGDLMHPGRLISCVMDFPPTDRDKYMNQDCFVSFDSGKTWDSTLRITEGSGDGDPTMAYGLGDDVYVAVLVLRMEQKIPETDPDVPRHDADTVVFKSTDGGRTWKEASRFGFIDREFIGVDTSNSKYRGRVYVVGQTGTRETTGGSVQTWQMFRSLDGGKTFLGPIHAMAPGGAEPDDFHTGGVLSDGTYVWLISLLNKGRTESLELEPSLGPNAQLLMASTRDGGESLSPAHKIADWTIDRRRSEGGVLGQMAVDPGSKLFKDRIYVTYPEIVDDRNQIRFTYSSDKGKTWSKPVTISDDRSPEKGGNGPDHLLPAVGINQDGVVLVAWYDRREAKDNLGWRMRAAASLDGGETFSASVPITDNVNAYPANMPWDAFVSASTDQTHSLVSIGGNIGGAFFTSAGHTSGVAVDADGTFHPTWIDNHTGIAQLWSASLKVDGAPVTHGDASLADLKDISKSVSLELSKPVFDRARGTLTANAQLKNISKGTVEGPVKVRVLTLESELGVPEITNADNGKAGSGAIWDFSSQVSGPLASMKLSGPKTLTFRVTGLRALAAGKDFKGGVLDMDAKVYGKVRKDESDKDKDADDNSKKDQQSGGDRNDDI